MTIEEAVQELKYVPADIQEAREFADRKVFDTAVGILTAVSRTLETIAKEYPELHYDITPMVLECCELTVDIITRSRS